MFASRTNVAPREDCRRSCSEHHGNPEKRDDDQPVGAIAERVTSECRVKRRERVLCLAPLLRVSCTGDSQSGEMRGG